MVPERSSLTRETPVLAGAAPKLAPPPPAQADVRDRLEQWFLHDGEAEDRAGLSLQPWYQGKVGLDGEIREAEALVRMRDLRNNNGVIGAYPVMMAAKGPVRQMRVTKEMVQRVVRDVPALREASNHAGFRVSLNVPVDQVTAELADLLTNELRRNSVHPESLCIEIIEPERPATVAPFNALIRRGMKVEIDDIGKKVRPQDLRPEDGPVDADSIGNLAGEINPRVIDKLAVKDVSGMKIDRDALSSARLLPAVVQLQRQLGLKVTVEGVERPHELLRLQRLAVVLAQHPSFGRNGVSQEDLVWLHKELKADQVYRPEASDPALAGNRFLVQGFIGGNKPQPVDQFVLRMKAQREPEFSRAV